MFSFLETSKIKDKKEALKNEVNRLKLEGVTLENIFENLEGCGWGFIEFKEMFSSSFELCIFVGVTEACWQGIRWRS